MTNNHFPEQQQQQQQQQQDPDPMAIPHHHLAVPVDDNWSRSSPRPPSYKLDTHIDLDALERGLRRSFQLHYHQHHHKLSKWQHQFHGTPLVFWLVFFVLIGIVSLFTPSLVVALTLWLPLLLYMTGLTIYHRHYKKSHHSSSLQEITCQLAAIHRRRQRVLTRVSEYPAEQDDLYFLYATSDQYTHPVTTLLPPPPSYQRINS